MLTTLPFITLDEMRAFSGITSIKPEIDNRLIMCISNASLQIERITQRIFTRQPLVEYFKSTNNTSTNYATNGDSSVDGSAFATVARPLTVYLKGAFISPDDPLNVWYDNYPNRNDAHGDDHLLVPDEDYFVDYDNCSIKLLIPMVLRPRGIKVSYTGGYSNLSVDTGEEMDTLSGDLPEPLKLACLVQAQFLNVKLRTDNIGMEGERVSSGKDRVSQFKFTTNAGLTDEVVGMVRHLYRVKVGSG